MARRRRKPVWMVSLPGALVDARNGHSPGAVRNHLGQWIVYFVRDGWPIHVHETPHAAVAFHFITWLAEVQG